MFGWVLGGIRGDKKGGKFVWIVGGRGWSLVEIGMGFGGEVGIGVFGG